MNLNLELLNYINKNVEMGTTTIQQVFKSVEDDGLKKALEYQLVEYETIKNQCQDMLRQHQEEPKDISLMTQITTYMMINMKTLTDKSSSHIASMFIEGSTMGVTDMIQKRHKYTECEPSILALADKLQQTEEYNIENLKKYL